MRRFLSTVTFVIVLINMKRIGTALRSKTNDKIKQNMVQLQQYRWFQELLDDARFGPIIVHDPDVQQLIGSLRKKQIHCNAFGRKARRKIERIVRRKTMEMNEKVVTV